MLTGPNGSGKSTLLRALAGYLRPAAGSIRWVAEPEASASGGQSGEVAEVCHFVGHLDGLKAHLSAAENLAFWSEYLGGADATRSTAEKVEAALEQFRLEALGDIPAGYLSAGQRRRLALARLAVVPRPLWLLDEPTVSLDDASIGVLTGAINAHLAAGGMAVIATHVPMQLVSAQALALGRSEAGA